MILAVEWKTSVVENKKKKKKNSGLSRNWTLAVTLYPVSYSSLLETRGPFLESPGNFSGRKSNVQIEI